jgi:hypothetical protein
VKAIGRLRLVFVMLLFALSLPAGSLAARVAAAAGSSDGTRGAADVLPLARRLRLPADDCRFVLGFAAVHQRLPARIGACLADEQPNPGLSGEAQLQPTTGGLLIWRKQGNLTAFTDGAFTWIAGPGGLRRWPNPPQLRFAWIAPPPTTSCRFTGGFGFFSRLVPGIIGQCLGNERDNPVNATQPNAPFQRDGVQHTTRGLLAYRFVDNHTAFTDGYRTIVHGPCGMEERLNTQRFPWEGNPERLPVVPDAYPTELAQLPSPSPPADCRS